ncbi:MAG: SdpI family protein [Coriobacteriia bacterium]
MKFKDMPKLPLFLIAAMFVVGAIAYPTLPAQIPVHWGPTGQIDGWAAKSFWSVFLAPLIAAGLYVLLWFAPYLDPKRANLLKSRKIYAIVLHLMTVLMAVIFVGTLFAARDTSLPMSSIIELVIGVMFAVIGFYLRRVPRNWTMGVRYSFTLMDDEVWRKTNILGGWFFMGAGVLAVIGAFLPPMWGIALLLAPIVVMLPVTYVYSMLLYRKLHPDEMAIGNGEHTSETPPEEEPSSGLDADKPDAEQPDAEKP